MLRKSIIVACTLALVGAAPAGAGLQARGARFSSAVLAKPGVRHHGFVSRIGWSDGSYRDFWKIRLRALDTVTVSWTARDRDRTTVYVFPAGTTDRNVRDGDEIDQEYAERDGSTTFRFSTRRAGYHYLMFVQDSRARYSFRFSVKHWHR